MRFVLLAHSQEALFLIKIVGGKMMDYILEILPALVSGAGMTLKVFFFTLLGSIPLGIIIAFILQSSFKPLRYLINLYIWLMRGTPLLLQLILFLRLTINWYCL